MEAHLLAGSARNTPDLAIACQGCTAHALIRVKAHVCPGAARQPVDFLALAQYHIGDTSVVLSLPVPDPGSGCEEKPAETVGLRQRGRKQLAGSGKASFSSGLTREACYPGVTIEADGSRCSVPVSQ